MYKKLSNELEELFVKVNNKYYEEQNFNTGDYFFFKTPNEEGLKLIREKKLDSKKLRTMLDGFSFMEQNEEYRKISKLEEFKEELLKLL